MHEEVEFFVLEQTMVNGVSYILVTDSEDDDAECLILKDTSGENQSESVDGSVAESEIILPTLFGEREIRIRIETCGRIDLHIALDAVGANLLSGGSQPTKCSGNN